MIEYRSLREEELESWFDHCAEVFEGASREYFLRHWANDPFQDLNSIFVAVEENKILSTVRVFHREIYIHGKKVKMGGIGEVSTKAEARKKGLSTQLLNKCIEYMKEQGVQVSILFGNQLNYSKLGWRFIDLNLNISEIEAYKGLYKIREVDFHKDAKVLMAIYEKYNLQFNGTVVRNNQLYWIDWIKSESKSCFAVEDYKGNIVGYMSVSNENDTLLVKDFAAKLGSENVFEELGAYACNKLGAVNQIKYPAVIKNTLNIKANEKIEDIMVRLISPFQIGDTSINNTDELIEVLNNGENNQKSSEFIFWVADSF